MYLDTVLHPDETLDPKMLVLWILCAQSFCIAAHLVDQPEGRKIIKN